MGAAGVPEIAAAPEVPCCDSEDRVTKAREALKSIKIRMRHFHKLILVRYLSANRTISYFLTIIVYNFV